MEIPSRIADRYDILRKLGEGTGGLCYLARDRKSDNRLVALKIVPLQGQGAESFRREGRLLKSISHPHLARLFDEGETEGFRYYSSEYVEGDDFVTASKKRDWNAVFSLVVQAAWALQYLHDKKIIHRDLKPANILVGKIHSPEDSQERLHLKIIDFGLAAVLDRSGSRPTTGGSLATMAPEILQGKEYDHRSDLYSFGVVLYEAALGKLPQERGKSFAVYLERLAQEEIDLAPLQKSETPKGMIEVIGRLVRKEPGRRPKEAREIIRILNAAENEHFPLSLPPVRDLPKPIVSSKKQQKGGIEETGLPPGEILTQLQDLSRSGQKADALAFAEKHLPQVVSWKEADLVQDFYASLLHSLIIQGLFDQAKRHLGEMRGHPTLRNHPSIEVALLEAQLNHRQGDPAAAKKILETIPKDLIRQSPPAKQARYENETALVCQALKVWKEAAAHYEKAALLSERSGRRDHQVSLLTNAGALHFEQGDWTHALEILQKAVTIARELHHPSLTATAANNLGNLYLHFGRWTEAEALLSESLQIAFEQGLKPLIVSNLCLLTVTEDGRGNWEKIGQHLDRVLSYTAQLGDAQPILQALLAKGYFELTCRDFVRCGETVRTLLDRAAKIPPYLLQARWLSAKLRIAQGRFEDPETTTMLNEVIGDARGRGTFMVLWQALADLGDLARGRSDPEAARRCYEEALQILEGLKARIPPPFQESFFRDRKKERIRTALEEITRKDDPMNRQDAPQAPSFPRWAEINRRLLLQHRIEPLLEEILDAAIGLTDAERGFVILSERQALEIGASRNFNREALKGDEERFSSSIAQEVLRRGEPVLLLDAQVDARFSEAASVQALSIRSVLCVPLRAGARPIGLIYLDNRFRQGIFRQEHLPLLEALADQASLVLEHTRLHRENAGTIEELKKAKETIERLNAKLQQDLSETTADLEAVREGLKRQNEEIALRYTYDKIVGKGARMREVLKGVDRIIDTDMNVYLLGESGTGKELVAQAIHYNGPRKDKPFLALNCAALPENLIESELFGHVKGAFTGADQERIGVFEAADGGTLFLDEVGEMSPGMQAKLLRILEEGQVRRIGGNSYRKVDVRVLTASNKDLKELVAQGTFRQDLFYRLHVARIKLPPLRERREDIPLLIDSFLDEMKDETGARPRLTKEALRVLSAYDWPGNIRELRNEIQRVSLFGREITPDLISPHILEGGAGGARLRRGLDPLIAELEKKTIEEAMSQAGGNKVKAARLLKIGRRTLYTKLALYRIDEK